MDCFNFIVYNHSEIQQYMFPIIPTIFYGGISLCNNRSTAAEVELDLLLFILKLH